LHGHVVVTEDVQVLAIAGARARSGGYSGTARQRMLQRGRQFRPAIRKAPLQVQEGPSPGFILAGLGERGGFRDQRGAQFLHQFAQVVFQPFAASADEFMKRSSAFFSHFGFYARNCRGGLSHRSISKAYPNPENHRAMTLCRSFGRGDAESVHAGRWPPLSVRPCKIIRVTMEIRGSGNEA
jgi:hypothetical protein